MDDKNGCLWQFDFGWRGNVMCFLNGVDLGEFSIFYGIERETEMVFCILYFILQQINIFWLNVRYCTIFLNFISANTLNNLKIRVNNNNLCYNINNIKWMVYWTCFSTYLAINKNKKVLL